MTEIFYRFKCHACDHTREVRSRDAVPDYCPLCSYPKDRAGHLYRPEPQDGEALDA
jgi:hypothetical protein